MTEEKEAGALPQRRRRPSEEEEGDEALGGQSDRDGGPYPASQSHCHCCTVSGRLLTGNLTFSKKVYVESPSQAALAGPWRGTRPGDRTP
mmetsp:Transcript_3220/g.10895  ORF Transcript_3220/g.10895 Transcript_3220/m.10895 type:complete len:90 (+) Transcript_3220:1095-1364(+)